MQVEIHYLKESHILLFLLQVLVLLGLSRALGEALRRIHQPSFPAEILVGVVLGPTILGRFFPGAHHFLFPPDIIQQAMLETVAWLGVFFLLLQTGLEIDFSKAWRQKGDAVKIATIDIVVPMLIAFVPCWFLADKYLVNPTQRFGFAIFIATAMTISAMPVAARALHDLKLLKTNMGFLIMSALSVNDILGWLIFTLVLGFFTHENLDIPRILLILASTVGFVVICLTYGRGFASAMISHFKRNKMPEPASSLTFVCILGLIGGAFTQWIGIHALFGFFVAGIVVGEARELSERTRQIISQMVFAIFVPLFFANIGLKIDFIRNFDWFLVLFITIIGVFGRFLGAWLGAFWANTPVENRLPIAIAHTPGGAMEVVIGILALENDLITETVFIAIVVGAVLSSVVFGPWMSWAIRRRKHVAILEFFSRRLIIPQLRANSRDQALVELCEAIAEEESLDTEEILSAVRKREELMGTSFEDMLAIPHARITSLRRPVIAFGVSRPGLEWDSPDGLRTQLVFLVLVPESAPDIHVQILQAIATVMSESAVRRALLQAADQQSVWSVLETTFMSHRLKQR